MIIHVRSIFTSLLASILEFVRFGISWNLKDNFGQCSGITFWIPNGVKNHLLQVPVSNLSARQ